MSEQTIGVEQGQSGQIASMEIMWVAVSALVEDPNHERRTYLEMEEFTEKIRAEGVLEPPVRSLGQSQMQVLVCHEPMDERTRQLRSLLSNIHQQEQLATEAVGAPTFEPSAVCLPQLEQAVEGELPTPGAACETQPPEEAEPPAAEPVPLELTQDVGAPTTADATEEHLLGLVADEF